VNEALSLRIHKFLLSKSRHWKYEKEWRVIINCENPTNRFQTFPNNLLKGVIFGCQMHKDNEDMIHRWIQNGRIDPKLYRTSKKENEYGVKIEIC
jgi:hypothetical protein